MNRASLIPVALLALAPLALVAGGALLLPRAAEACSYAAAKPAAVRPVAEETGVPTNAQLWLTGSSVTEVTLTAGASAVPVAVTALKVYPVHLDRLYQVKPAALLSPGTRYTVTIKSSYHPDVSFSFTSGAGELRTAPDAPATLGAGARQLEAGNSCYDGLPFLVKVSAPAVPGAALYELQASTDGGERFASLGFSASSTIELPAAALPSPVYRLRPLAITGLGTDEELLPIAEVPENEMPLDRIPGAPAPPGSPEPAPLPDPPKKNSGCSASGAGGSSSALWLASAILGWSLWQRRRRRGARSLSDLGLG